MTTESTQPDAKEADVVDMPKAHRYTDGDPDY